MAGKKPLGTLQPIEKTSEKPKLESDAKGRGTVQTVRMDLATLKALKYASIERGESQNEIMLRAIQKELGLA